MGSNFKEISSKILLVFVLCESHKIMCTRSWKGNGESSRTRRIIIFLFNFSVLHCVELSMREQRKIRYLQPEVNRASQQILQYRILNPQHTLRCYYIGTQKLFPDKTPSSFYPTLFCALQLLLCFQEMCFGIGAET